MKRRLTILGCTGSVGRQTLDVVRSYRERFEVVGLSAFKDAETLRQQAEEFRPENVALESGDDASLLDDLAARKIIGPGAAASLAEAPSDVVLNAIVGFAGLAATVGALEAGNTVALANKESLVAGGEWVMRLASDADNRIIPVDSEHSAIFQCLEGKDDKEVREVLLTASGGPFFEYVDGQRYVVSVVSHGNPSNIQYYTPPPDCGQSQCRYIGQNTWGPYFNDWATTLVNRFGIFGRAKPQE